MLWLPALHPEEPGYSEDHPLKCAKVLGGALGRPRAFRPESVVNISAMSFGSLSATAVESMNRGARLANYIVTLRKELKQLSHACGVKHPALITLEHFLPTKACRQL